MEYIFESYGSRFYSLSKIEEITGLRRIFSPTNLQNIGTHDFFIDNQKNFYLCVLPDILPDIGNSKFILNKLNFDDPIKNILIKENIKYKSLSYENKKEMFKYLDRMIQIKYGYPEPPSTSLLNSYFSGLISINYVN